jgi:hypothetical protein
VTTETETETEAEMLNKFEKLALPTKVNSLITELNSFLQSEQNASDKIQKCDEIATALQTEVTQGYEACVENAGDVIDACVEYQ